MKTFFYVKTMRSITVALLDVFNNLNVNRYNTSGSIVKTIDVPIKFGPLDKAHVFKKIRESGRKYYMPIPQMGLRLLSHTRNADRVVSPHDFRELFNQDVDDSQIESFIKSFQPTPVDLSYELKIRTESLADYSQLIENIQPYFNPSIFLRVKEGFGTLNWERDVKVTLDDSISLTYPEEMSEEDFRFIEGSLNLTAEAWMYKGPDSEEDIIKFTKVFYQTANSKDLEVYSTSGMASSATPPTSYVYGDYIDANTVYYTDIYGATTSATSGSSDTSGFPLVPPGSGSPGGSGDYIENRTATLPIQSASFSVDSGYIANTLTSNEIYSTIFVNSTSAIFNGVFRTTTIADDDVGYGNLLRFQQANLINLSNIGELISSDIVGNVQPVTLVRNDDVSATLDGPGVYMSVSGTPTIKMFSLDIHDNIPQTKTFIIPDVSVPSSATTYQITETDLGKKIRFNSSSDCVVYLMDATILNGFHFYARNEGGGGLSVEAAGAETIQGSGVWTSAARYNHVILDKTSPSYVWIVNENQ